MTEEELKEYIAKNGKIDVFGRSANDYEYTMIIDDMRIGVFFPKKIVEDFMNEQGRQLMFDTLIQRKLVQITDKQTAAEKIKNIVENI